MTNVGGGGLKSNTSKHDGETNHDSETTSSPIGKEGRDWDGANRASGHDGVDETQFSGIWVDCSGLTIIRNKLLNK